MTNEQVGEQITKLTNILGFDPAKSSAPTAELMKEALAEITKENSEKAKVRAKELLTKAIGLRQEFAQTEKKYNEAKGKFQKELGKILGSIEALNKGEPEPASNEEKLGDVAQSS